jgi:hypothetical protein
MHSIDSSRSGCHHSVWLASPVSSSPVIPTMSPSGPPRLVKLLQSRDYFTFSHTTVMTLILPSPPNGAGRLV